MTRRRHPQRKHTRESRRNRENPRNSAEIREISPTRESARGCTPGIRDLAPLAGAILCILAIAIIGLACPKPPPQTSPEEAASAQLARKIAHQALAVELAAERFRRKTLFPVFE